MENDWKTLAENYEDQDWSFSSAKMWAFIEIRLFCLPITAILLNRS